MLSMKLMMMNNTSLSMTSRQGMYLNSHSFRNCGAYMCFRRYLVGRVSAFSETDLAKLTIEGSHIAKASAYPDERKRKWDDGSSYRITCPATHELAHSGWTIVVRLSR
jgi:hypothetical protein